MANYNIKARLAMCGMTSKELAVRIAEQSEQYNVRPKDLSEAINWNGRLTEKQRWILETADRILREIEGAQVSERKEG